MINAERKTGWQAGIFQRQGPGKIRPAREVLALALIVFTAAITIPCSSPVFGQHTIPPEAWIEMRKMLREKSPATTVEQDIAALAGSGSRQAGPKLIDRGPAVLSKVHAALAQEDIAPRQAIGLLQVIRALADEQSVPVLLQLLQRTPPFPYRRDALLVLANLPSTDAAARYVLQLAADEDEPWNTRRMAYTWFGLHRDQRGRIFAEALLSDPDPGKQAIGLYVLARLGDKSALDPITRIMAAGPPANMRDALMTSLAELATPEQFMQIVPESLAWSSGYKDALLYARYRQNDDKERPSICLQLLHSELPGYMATAVRCLLQSGHAGDLRPSAALSLEAPGREALIRNEIRKAGWRIIDTDTEFDIIPGDPRNGL